MIIYTAYDPELNFHYYGEEEPRGGMYRDYLANPKVIAIDIETPSLIDRTPLGISIAVSPQVAFYFPLYPSTHPMVPWKLLNDNSVTKILHNCFFDLLALLNWKYQVSTRNIVDTNIMAGLLNIKPSRLVDLANYMYMNGGKWMEVHAAPELIGKGCTMFDLSQEELAKKCCQDATATFGVYEFLKDKVDWDYFMDECRLIPVLIDMSTKGILIDQNVRQRLETRLENDVKVYSQAAISMGLNLGSTQQVGYVLAKNGAYNIFTRLPFTRGNKRKQLDTSETILKRMDNPLAALVLQYRAVTKLLGTYIRPWKFTDRAHTRFHMDAITGRISSTDRNMQNIPGGETRNMFIPDDEMFTDMDMSQIELRVLAYLSGDKEMQYILNDPDGDMHQTTADFMLIPRKLAKNVSFAMIYGATDETISETAGIANIGKARELKEMWFEKYREAGDWITTKQEEALRNPYAYTLHERKIRLPEVGEESIDRIKRKAVNYPIQGTAAEIMKKLLVQCEGMPMLLQVYDEVLFNGKIEPVEFNGAPFWTPIKTKYLERWE
jgi:DNA polymerase I